MALDMSRYEFDDTANYSVSNIDDIIELPNRLLYARAICSTINLCNAELS